MKDSGNDSLGDTAMTQASNGYTKSKTDLVVNRLALVAGALSFLVNSASAVLFTHQNDMHNAYRAWTWALSGLGVMVWMLYRLRQIKNIRGKSDGKV